LIRWYNWCSWEERRDALSSLLHDCRFLNPLFLCCSFLIVFSNPSLFKPIPLGFHAPLDQSIAHVGSLKPIVLGKRGWLGIPGGLTAADGHIVLESSLGDARLGPGIGLGTAANKKNNPKPNANQCPFKGGLSKRKSSHFPTTNSNYFFITHME